MRTRFLHFILIISFSIFSKIGYSQTIILMNTCDTTISDPSLMLPVSGWYTITVHSTNSSRLSFNLEQFSRTNGSDIYIYDGASTSSPLISHVSDYFITGINSGPKGGQTTGGNITFYFLSSGPTSVLPHFKMRIKCVQTPQNYPVFQPIGIPLGGNIQLTDYDGDGDKDLLAGGGVYRNDSYYDSLFLFERKSTVFDGWNKPVISSGDFDNDGLRDVFIIGNFSLNGGNIAPSAAVYKNMGNGNFSRILTQSFSGAIRGGICIVDFNNDGKLDISYTGATDIFSDNIRVFKLYINNGNMSFSDSNVSLPGISGLIDATISWSDSDNDGDKDLLINGYLGINSTNITKLFTSNGFNFTNISLNFTNSSNGEIRWVDVNLDGKPDIFNTGVSVGGGGTGITPEIFINNGANSYVKIISNLPNFIFGGYDWADYDSDGDLDIVMNGFTVLDAGLYKNNGGGQFTRINIYGSNGRSKLKWTDFNNDGKLDIVGSAGYYIKNMGADSFKISSFKATSVNDDTRVEIADFNNDGLIDFLLCGAVVDIDCNGSSTLVLGKGWKYHPIPKLTIVANVTQLNPNLGSNSSLIYYRWGDFDSDGKLDILATLEMYNGVGATYLVVYKNNGNNNFSLLYNSVTTPLIGPGNINLNMSQASVFDIDNDGVNELLVLPNLVYKKVNNQWVLYNYDGNNLEGGNTYVDFADYDNDGFTDVVVSDEISGSVKRNNQNGKFIDIYSFRTDNFLVFGTRGRQLKWVDIDNDGDKDIITGNGFCENRNGSFVFIHSQIQSMMHTGVGDFNRDGYKDLINIPYLLSIGPLEVYYNQQGTFFFDKQSMGTLAQVANQAFNQAAESFDIDNDGDDDIIHTGAYCGGSVIVNEGNFNNSAIAVVSPNGGENYLLNTNAEIKWFGSQISNSVKLEISRDSGLTWQPIIVNASSTASGGSYLWNIVGLTSLKCLIKITDNNNLQLIDKSNAVFKITNPLIVQAGNDTTICNGSSVQIGSNSVATNAYTWTSNPLGFSSSIANPVVNPSITTSYFLSVSNGISIGKDTINITVNQVGVPSVSINSSGINICSGSPVTFTATATNGGTTPTYQWQVNGLNVGVNSNIFTTNTLTNNAQVKCVLTSNAACASPQTVTSNVITVAVNPVISPTLSISSTSTTICASSPITFTAVPINGGLIPTYQWQINGTNVGTNSPTFTSSTLNNNDQVKCILTSNAACATPQTVTSNTIAVSVNSAVLPAVSITSTATNICSGSSITFSATPTNGGTTPSYQWQINGVNVGANTNTFTSSTLINASAVKVIMTSSLACALPQIATSNTINITVNNTVTPTASFTSSATSICNGASITFTSTSTNVGTSPIYQWKKNGISVGTNTATYTSSGFANGDAITLTLTSNAACASNVAVISSPVIITVSAEVPTITIAGNTTVVVNNPTNITSSITFGGTLPTYQWQDSTNLHTWANITGATSASLAYTPTAVATGNKVRCVMTSNSNCALGVLANSNVLTFDVTPSIAPPNPTGGYTLRYFPNPVSTILTIDSLQLSKEWESVKIITAQGLEYVSLTNFLVGKTKATVNVEALVPGVYFLLLTRKQGVPVYLKFIKE